MMRLSGVCQIAFLIAAGTAAGAEPNLPATNKNQSETRLRERIAAVESGWHRCSVEIMRFAWPHDGDAPSSDVEHYLRLGDKFRIHEFKRANDPKSNPEMIIRQWDGDCYTTIFSEREVERRRRVRPPHPVSPIYGVILRELGFEGTIDQFLSTEPSGESSRLFELHVEIEALGDETIAVKRSMRIAGSKPWKVIELHLNAANDLLPYSGTRYDVDPDGSRIIHREVRSTMRETGENALHYELLSTSDGDLMEIATSPKTALRVRAERLAPAVTFDEIRVKELVGDPMIRQYEGNELKSEQRFRPPQQPPPQPWPVIDKWLVINDIFLTVAVLVIVGRMAQKRLFGCRRAKRSTSANVAAFALISIELAGCVSGDRMLAIEVIQQPPAKISQFETFRMTFHVKNAVGNPFDPDDVNAYLKITTPSGTEQIHPAFFTRDFEIAVTHGREVARDLRKKHWELRWTPTQVGQYRWTLCVESVGQISLESGTLKCLESNDAGFVRVSTSDPNYFEMSDGSFFYPLGHVTRSPFDDRWGSLTFDTDAPADNAGNGDAPGAFRTAKYERWFKKMHEAGENFCTVWMAPWWLGLEWSPTREGYSGVGHYNQKHAAQLDRIFKLAEDNGIYVFLFTSNHGRYATAIDPEWFDNPHLRDAVSSPADYFESADCQQYDEHRLRYILARWGYSKALFGISLCTEVSWIDPYYGFEARPGAFIKDGMAQEKSRIPRQRELIEEWFREMVRFVKETDVHQHPVSIQFARLEDGIEAWQNPEFEIVLNNVYRTAMSSSHLSERVDHAIAGMADGSLAWSRYADCPAKPRLIAEWGGHHMANVLSSLDAELHTGIWGMSMTDLSGVTGFWWANEIDRGDLYRRFAPIHRFWKDYDRRGKKLLCDEGTVVLPLHDASQPEDSPPEFVPHPTRRAIVLANQSEVFAYIYHHHANSADVPIHNNLFPIEREALLSLPQSLLAGTYVLEFWNPDSGTVVLQRTRQLDPSVPDTLLIELPEFRVDLALKVRQPTSGSTPCRVGPNDSRSCP